VQLISRKKGADQYYINFPTAVAESLEFVKGETIEWIIEDKANIIAHRPNVPPSPVEVKKKTSPLVDHWEALWAEFGPAAASTPSCVQRYHDHLIAHLLCPGRHTVTSLITTHGAQFADWTAHYDLYAKDRVNPRVLFKGIRSHVEALIGPQKPLVVALDDTILRKTGRLIPGAAYRKDPLGPPFNVNLVWAQRMIQFSAALPNAEGEVRMIPIDFVDASTPRKPRKNEPEEKWAAYRETMKQRNLNEVALQTLHRLRSETRDRALLLVVDGSFTNEHFLKKRPSNTVVIGRIRKDAHLNALPEAQSDKGRRRIYGAELPTPEEIRKDKSIPWQRVRVFAAGKKRNFSVKTLERVRWRKAGKEDLRLVVIRACKYRGPGKKPLYRQPAYLICTDPELPLKELLQTYIWRWDIEVNHRDEKTLLGVGQAQVRNPLSAWSIPASAVAAYAMLHLAAVHAYGWTGKPNVIPLPHWRDPGKKRRASTLDLVNELRRELWVEAIHSQHLRDFVNGKSPNPKSQKCKPNLASCLFAATA
jgi:hypothetical protein